MVPRRRGGRRLRTAQFALHVAAAHLGIAEELRRCLVSADERDLGHAETHLEETRNRLVPEIVKIQVLEPRPPAEALPGLAQGPGACGEEPRIVSRQCAENAQRLWRERHASAAAVLGQRQEGDAALQVDVRPAQAEQLTAVHGGLDGDGDQRPQPGQPAAKSSLLQAFYRGSL